MPRIKLAPHLAGQFLKSLYGSFFSQAPGPAYLEVRGKREGEELGFRRFYPNVAALLQDMAKWPPNQNYWVGVALRKNNRGGKKEDLKALTASFGDVDCGADGHKAAPSHQTKAEALAAIEQFPLRPNLLVDSGGGFQPYWLFREPIELTDGNLARVERINRGIALALGGDVAATDAARILRLPGTFNMKLPDKPRPVKIIWCESERVYNLADFAEYEAKSKVQNPQGETRGRPDSGGEYEAYVQKALADELVKLARTPEGSHNRNNQLNKSAKALGELIGASVLDRGQVEAALYGVAVSIGLGEVEAKATIKSGLEAGIREPRELPKKPTKEEVPGAKPGDRADSGPPPTSAGLPIWPEGVMTGAAGAFTCCYASYLETPAPFLFMDFLTLLGHLISDKITLASEIAPQSRLYTVNLGESADTRKSTSINKTVNFFLDAINREDINLIRGVGSAEGLAKAFSKQHRGILVLDELKSLVQKCRIEGSVLLPCVNTLFELNHFHSLTQKHDIKIDDAEFCLLAASTLDTYRNMFTPQFLDIGFVNRLFIVIGGSERRFAVPQMVPEHEKEALRRDLREVLKFAGTISQGGRHALPLTSEARDVFESWYFALEHSTFAKRLDTYGHRLMILLAVNEMQATITPEITERTVALLNYQLAARKFADPIDADNAIARLEERIRRLLSPDTPTLKRDLERRGSKARVGTWAWNMAISNLIKGQEVIFDWQKKAYFLAPE